MTKKEQLYEGKAKKFARLTAEKEFGLTEAEMTELLTPALYIGRCPEQVMAFVEKVKPLLADADGKSAEINL